MKRTAHARRIENILFFLLHLAALSIFFVPFSWKMVTLCIGLYYLRMFGITAGYHRYFSHRAFKTSRAFQFILAWLGATALQRGPLWWAAHHRHHHRFSDQAEDIHSPVLTGFWNSHVGWIISGKYDRTRFELIQDFAKYKELQWLNRHHMVPGVALTVLLFIFGGWAALAWGFFLSTVLLYHATFSINSLVHVFGSRRYATPDQSRNNPWLSLLTMGENWHNNHHAYMSSANQGFFWWELDLSFYVLRVLGVLGVVHGLRLPPMKRLEAKRQRPGLDEFARDEDEDIRLRIDRRRSLG